MSETNSFLAYSSFNRMEVISQCVKQEHAIRLYYRRRLMRTYRKLCKCKNKDGFWKKLFMYSFSFLGLVDYNPTFESVRISKAKELYRKHKDYRFYIERSFTERDRNKEVQKIRKIKKLAEKSTSDVIFLSDSAIDSLFKH